MKKVLIFTVSLVWLLTVHLSFISVEVSYAQNDGVVNPQGDLWGWNMGDQNRL